MRAWNSTLRPGKPMKRSAFKSRSPKRRSGHSKNHLMACRGQPCFLQVDGICLGAFGAETVVPCHANWHEYGKGMGLKAKDEYTVPGCMACHSWLDQGPETKDIKRAAWESAYRRWQPVRDQKNKSMRGLS